MKPVEFFKSNEPPVEANSEPAPYRCGAVPSSIICDSRNIVARFVAWAKRFPDEVAIVEGGNSVTYRRLLQQAHSLAVRLRLEHEPGAVAAIYGQRSIDTPLAMIACLLANITFVVVDAAYVHQRILDILTLSGAKTLLCTSLGDTLRDAVAALEVTPRSIRCEDVLEERTFVVGAHDTAYLLFTSGSTGFPKGIRTGHAPLIHFVDWYEKTFCPKPGSRFSLLAGLSHDPLLRDIFVPLSTGGQLHIPRQADIRLPDRLFDWIDASTIEFSHLTPQLIDILHARRHRERTLSRLKFVFCGGDVLRAETATHVQSIAPDAKLVNFYGTSETPQAMAYQVIEPDMTAPYPLGRPIADVNIEIVDEELRPMAVGTSGEIAIVTEYLSEGYIVNRITADAEPKRQVYVRRPDWIKGTASMMYLTGDVGFKDEHGRIFFSGRRDDQIKVHGYRVDCAEVAATIERHQLAQNVVVLPERSSSTGEGALLAFVVGDADCIRQSLAEVLPAHMVPAAVIAIPTIPILPNGKVDRAALYELRRISLESAHTARPHEGNAFFDAIAEAMNVASVNPEKSFVGMGGDSLSFIRVGFIIEDHLGKLPDDWETMPFSALYDMKRRDPVSAPSPSRLNTKHIEPAILLRAIAIVLVVLTHSRIGINVVATSTLFVVSGMSFARFLLPGLLEGKGCVPTLKFVAKYGVPAGLCQLRHQLYQPHIWWPDLFLLGTMWANPAEQHLTFWYLDILTAAIVITAAFASVLSKIWRRKSASGASALGYRFSMGMLTFAIIAFFLQTQLDRWNGEISVSSVGPFRWLWLFTLGAVIQTAGCRTHRILVTAIAFSLATLCYGNLITGGSFQQPFSVFLMVSIAVLTWLKRVPLPVLLHGPVLLLAQHSLFIYIFSSWVSYGLMPKIVEATGLPDWAPLRILLALMVGVVISILWTRALQLLSVVFNYVKVISAGSFRARRQD